METKQNSVYKLVDKAQADGVAWVFQAANTQAQEYPFKFPELGPTDIRIEQTYTGLCYSDVHLADSNWFPIPYPSCPGHEVVGHVVATGAEVTGIKVGDLVGAGWNRRTCQTCQYCSQGEINLCSGKNEAIPFPNFGGFATHVQCDYKLAFPVPLTIPPETAAPILCAGVTVYAGIKHNLRAGQSVCVAGIGGLGHLAIQVAHHLGSKVTAVSSSANKEKEAREFGADNFVLSTDPKQMEKTTGKFDLVVFTGSNISQEQFTQIFLMTRKGGKFLILGAPPSDVKLKLPFFALVTSQIHVVGSPTGGRQDFIECLNFFSQHQIYPKVEVFDFQDFNKAYDKMKNGQPRYRCVLKISDYIKNNLKK